MNALERLKVLINSSTPIVVMETVEEVRAVRMVRAACADLNLATFEWTIASGLARSGAKSPEPQFEEALPLGGYSATRSSEPEQNSKAIYNSQDPAQMLANLEAISVEAAFILKDFHRHLEEAVVVRRLRDVGQKFSTNRRTVIITGPHIAIPPELASLVEFFDLALPDRQRLRQIVDETLVRVSKTHTLQRKLDAAGLDTLAESLRGLTEEEAERAISQTLVARYALSPECITDVLEAKKALLKRSEMLEFMDATDDMASVGGLDNLKGWLAQRRNSWDDSARQFGLDPPKGGHHSRRPGLWQEPLRPRCCRGMEAAAGEVRHRRRLRQVHWGDGEAHPESLQSCRGPGALRTLDRRTGKSLCRKRARLRIG